MRAEVAGAEPIAAVLDRFAERFDRRFSTFLETVKDEPASLVDAMRYSALAPGKRIRPFLVSECCRLVGGSAEEAVPAAAAIECVHAFSLIHDDLPAMDDAELRRGRPTSHVQFGEALAILAGDALLALAFELLAAPSVTEREEQSRSLERRSDRVAALVGELARSTGRAGMIGGQVMDLEGEGQPIDLRRVEPIHRCKTARLFEAACRMGAISGGASAADRDKLGRYGFHLGRAFQIADDLLDVTARAAQTGKSVGRDTEAGKQTYPACVGIEASRTAARSAAEEATEALATFGIQAQALRELAGFVARA